MPAAEERGVTKAQAKSCPCEACKKGRGAPSKIAPLSIHGYSSQPSGGWQKTTAITEHVEPTLFMGVELETMVTRPNGRTTAQMRAINAEVNRRHPYPPEFTGQRYNGDFDHTVEFREYRYQYNRVEDARYRLEAQLEREGFGAPKTGNNAILATAEEAVSMAEPVGFWHAKHDGSVSGPEFASQPASLAYWYSIRKDLDLMFTSLLHAGVRSHVGDEAGMHISISLEAFTDSDHLMRFARLINANPRWSQRMSQRTPESMHWCHLGQGSFAPGNESALRRWAERVMREGYDGSNDRYVALNAQCGDQGRLEFRLPRGTLRLDRFYKNLEWVASMIEFTANFAATDSSTYMRWVMGQKGRFADLKGWFAEKFGLVESEEFIPAPATPSGTAVRNLAGQREPRIRFDDDYDDYDPEPSLCPCGDGCYENDCDSCDSRRCDMCGNEHDRPLDQYQTYTGFPMELHYHVDGPAIGPARVWNSDGTEATYNRYGHAIAWQEPTIDPASGPAPLTLMEAVQEARSRASAPAAMWLPAAFTLGFDEGEATETPDMIVGSLSDILNP